MPSEADLPYPKHDSPTPNTMAPRPHDQNTSATIGPAMNKMAAAKRSIPVAGGFLLAISL